MAVLVALVVLDKLVREQQVLAVQEDQHQLQVLHKHLVVEVVEELINLQELVLELADLEVAVLEVTVDQEEQYHKCMELMELPIQVVEVEVVDLGHK